MSTSSSQTHAWSAGSGAIRLKSLFVVVSIFIASLIVFFVSYKPPWAIEREAFFHEREDLRTLETIAKQMIANRVPGVKGEGDDAYIESFAAFCKYIAVTHPEIAVNAAAPNPFPGILRGESYDVLKGTAISQTDWLITSRIYNIINLRFRSGLRCGGYINTRPDNTDESFFEDASAATAFSDLAAQMIRDNASGVQGRPDHRFIVSFQSFAQYVAKKRPNIAVALDASNPFPGVLTGTSYSKLKGNAKGENDVLIESAIYNVFSHYERVGVDCGGHFHEWFVQSPNPGG